jgi:hypothetical protein
MKPCLPYEFSKYLLLKSAFELPQTCFAVGETHYRWIALAQGSPSLDLAAHAFELRHLMHELNSQWLRLTLAMF